MCLLLAGVAAQNTWSAAYEPAVPRMRGAYVMVMRSKPGGCGIILVIMKEVVKEKCNT